MRTVKTKAGSSRKAEPKVTTETALEAITVLLNRPKVEDVLVTGKLPVAGYAHTLKLVILVSPSDYQAYHEQVQTLVEKELRCKCYDHPCRCDTYTYCHCESYVGCEFCDYSSPENDRQIRHDRLVTLPTQAIFPFLEFTQDTYGWWALATKGMNLRLRVLPSDWYKRTEELEKEWAVRDMLGWLKQAFKVYFNRDTYYVPRVHGILRPWAMYRITPKDYGVQPTRMWR